MFVDARSRNPLCLAGTASPTWKSLARDSDDGRARGSLGDRRVTMTASLCSWLSPQPS